MPFSLSKAYRGGAVAEFGQLEDDATVAAAATATLLARRGLTRASDEEIPG